MHTDGEWKVVGAEDGRPNPNAGDWEIHSGRFIVACYLTWHDAQYICGLHNKAKEAQS